MNAGTVGESEAGQKLRLFIALEIPEGWRAWLEGQAQRLERLSPGYARWVRSESMHLTLAFLGYQPLERYGSIVQAMGAAAAGQGRFALSLGAPGYFGPHARPRVLWVDVVDRAGGLQRVHRALASALSARDIEFDARPLAPHITLGRARQEARGETGTKMAQAVRTLHAETRRLPEHLVEEMVLMQSQLSRQGARYTVRERVPVGG